MKTHNENSKVSIVINTNNAAFKENPYELSDILESIATYYRENGHFADRVYDSNGNNVGTIVEHDSSAPDLLSALEFLLADYVAIGGENLTGSSVPADKARAALRKAKGEA